MASYLDKVQVNSAITDNTKLDLGHQSITTMDFMQLNVATIHELVPGSKIDVKMESFARLNPLPVPTFGRASMRNRAFFVPFRTIFRGWNDMITDAVHVASDGYSGSAGVLSSVPTVDMASLADAFKNSIGTSSTDAAMLYASTSTAYDVSWSGAGAYYNFTVKGRMAIKVLEQLGYKIDWDAKSGECVLSAMPLLALVKIFTDWYYPQQYSNMATYDRLLALTNYDVSTGPLVLTSSDVASILTVCVWCQYDSDLLVSAWDNPNQPNAGNYSDFKLVNIDTARQVMYFNGTSYTASENGYVTNSSDSIGNTGLGIGRADAPFIVPTIANSTSSSNTRVATPISEYLLHSLHALTDYMKRHQLAGSRAFDRYLARFGKALPAEKMNRSLYLGAAMQDIQIGDVMSTADTISTVGSRGSQLGAYAGKGMSYGNGHFDFDTDEYGYFIILSSIVPATGYFQGIDPQVMRTTKLSFWTPEFDSLGSEPIGAVNVYMPQRNGDMNTGSKYDQVFGFVPRYATYKSPTCSDRLTGNFRLMSLNGGSALNASDAWHLMRTFDGSDDFNSNWANVVHSPDFISGYSDFGQYKRVFYDVSDDAPDNFTVIHNFEIAEYAPMKALYDSYEFEDKGKKVTLETNGVKMN